MKSAAEELSRGPKQAVQVRQLVSSGAGVQTQAAWLQRACVLARLAFELENWPPQAESEEENVCSFIWVPLPSLPATFLHSFCLSFFLVKASFVYNKIHMLSCINFDQIFSIVKMFKHMKSCKKKKKKVAWILQRISIYPAPRFYNVHFTAFALSQIYAATYLSVHSQDTCKLPVSP